MSRPITLGDLKSRCRERADMEKSTFVTDSELTGYINDSLTKLYDLLVLTFGADYFIEEFQFSTVPNQKAYDLPEDFYKLKGVDLVRAGNGNNEPNITLKPFMFLERNKQTFFDSFRYRIVGNQIRFLRPEGTREIILWYVPISPPLVDDTDTFNGVNGYEEYVVIDVAIKMLLKEESDVSVLLSEKRDMQRRIEESADNRDEGQSDRVVDVRNIGTDDQLFFDDTLDYS